MNQKQRERYHRNIEAERAYGREKYARNRESESARKAVAYQQNREKFLARNNRWREANRERERATNRAYYWNNLDKVRGWHAEYYSGNKSVFINARHRRRAKMAGFLKFTAEQVDQRMSMFGYKCWICKAADFEHVDHVKPISKGGPHLLSNLRPSCARCNWAKGDKWPYASEEVVV
ncbi:HNH endonuclease [Tsukamurella tyrosinosolvens]|uniref:HNH endonuclease n=1 Tax=Tsukamurella tyrosinosolvens TaxID=57704 RepID=UPI003462D173